MAPDYISTFQTLPGWVDDYGMLVKACHHSLDIVLVERIKIALNQFFFSGHVCHLRVKLFVQIRSAAASAMATSTRFRVAFRLRCGYRRNRMPSIDWQVAAAIATVVSTVA